jgi:hypothetical protein
MPKSASPPALGIILRSLFGSLFYREESFGVVWRTGYNTLGKCYA